jgi:hypothetical protein
LFEGSFRRSSSSFFLFLFDNAKRIEQYTDREKKKPYNTKSTHSDVEQEEEEEKKAKERLSFFLYSSKINVNNDVREMPVQG